jgi:hypothetical protein
MRNLFDAPGNAKPVEFSRTKGFEDEQIECTLQQIGLF